MALEFTTDNFDEHINSDKVTVVDFWAQWCGPCKMVGPVIEDLANDYDGKAHIGKVNIDEQGDIAAQYGIRNIPTILFIKNGEVVDKQVGAVPKSTLEDKLKALL